MRVLISGGAGFIGSHLCRVLLDRGHEITVLDSLHPQIHGLGRTFTDIAELSGARCLLGDVRDRSAWLEALDGQEAVVHLAADTGTGQSMYEVERYVDVNARGTALLLDVLANARHGVARVVVASSRAVYGEGKYRCREHGIVFPQARRGSDMEAGDFAVKCPMCRSDVAMHPTDEDSKLHPTSVYGISKFVQEQLVATVASSLGLSAGVLRFQNVFGPGQSLSNPYTGIISIFSTRMLRDEPIAVFEDGTESRDFVYVSDVVEATRRAVESAAGGIETYNIGTGTATSVLQVAQTLRYELGSSSTVDVNGKFRVGDIRHCVADMSRARERLEVPPTMPFEEGIRRFVHWAREQATAVDDRYGDSLEEMRRRGLYR